MTRQPILDAHGRQASYLRLSVTDRCNLRCRYCMPEGVKFIPHKNILRYEELAELTQISRSMGVTKVRLTGGEPFVRKGFMEFVEGLQADNPGLDIRITTNGTLTVPYLERLADAGVTRLNISLDSLDRNQFESITGYDHLGTVLETIERSLDLGIRIKINAVAMKGHNDHQLPRFIDLARNYPLDMRFIEFMPVGGCTTWQPESIWTASEILKSAEEYTDLIPADHDETTDGPARMFTLPGSLGRFGVISPLSHHFCGTCNRLRITPTGGLRTCLFSDREYRLRPVLRHPKLGAKTVREIMTLAGHRKPMGVDLLKARKRENQVCSTRMSAIGG